MAEIGCDEREGLPLPVVTANDIVSVDIKFTDSAKSALKQSLKGEESTHVLVISAQSGGCSGFMYDMKIVENPGESGYQISDVEGISVFVHNTDSPLLSDITVDYKNTMMGGGFQITNATAAKSCGCGQSFG
jgi:iron-sulfur cluster assembly protein|tara:strand:- start:103612 stop:104007 length:396 start_codon:yes stop_codon:yes gene_type:complete